MCVCVWGGAHYKLDKYDSGHFGTCPRYYCEKMGLLPVGQHDQPGQSPVRLYCPNCKDIYVCNNNKFANVDGKYYIYNNVFFFLY